MNIIIGRVWKFGDNIDTDLIIPARYLNTSNPHELAKHVMEDANPEFPKKVRPGDIIVAGYNFGSGSSREHAPIALKAAGISAVIAKSFARIFYRNSFNMGLPIFELTKSDEINECDLIKINLDEGTIHNIDTGKDYKFTKIPEFMQQLITEGGIINFAKELLKEKNEKI